MSPQSKRVMIFEVVCVVLLASFLALVLFGGCTAAPRAYAEQRAEQAVVQTRAVIDRRVAEGEDPELVAAQEYAALSARLDVISAAADAEEQSAPDWKYWAEMAAAILFGGPAATLAAGVLTSKRMRGAVFAGKPLVALGFKSSQPDPEG